MIALLDSIYRNADPLQYLHMNSGRAAIYLERMRNTVGQEHVANKFSHAVELLKSGQNEAAIVQFKELIAMTGDVLNDQTKILHELLALSYMRLGEQENCINTHNPESCILPIQGSGVYALRAGPQNAVKIYERLLETFPDDYQTLWLFNLAHMAMGQWPDAVPPKFRLPERIFEGGEERLFRDVAIPLGVDVRGVSGGVCLEDFDNDDDIDIFTTIYTLDGQARYFVNNGDGTFTDRTAEANLMGIVSGLNAIHADYNNDGYRDIFILRGAWLFCGNHPNSLLRNNGDGTFTDVTIEAGLLSFHPTQTADWADFDGDGWLDLFIANETYNPNQPNRCELYHNNGDGTFTNVAAQLGVDYIGFFKAAVWGDVNNDQRPDLYLSNLMGQNLLLINHCDRKPETWRFENVANRTQTFYPMTSFPAFFFDYNNDGWEDILSTNFPTNYEDPTVAPLVMEYLGKQPEGDWLRLYRNNGDGTFTDVHQKLGLHTITYGMGNNFGDFDNDGWPDIYLGTGKPDLRSLIPNRAFRNVEGQRFEDRSMRGFGHIQKGHGVAFADIDRDGDQDLYIVVGGAVEGDLGYNVLYENPGNNNAWATFLLEGTHSNRDAIGARIRVTVRRSNGSTRDIYATVGTGGSFGSSSLQQEMGLGDAEKIEQVEIQWPLPGTPKVVYKDVPLRSFVRIKEGQPNAEVLPWKPIPFRKNGHNAASY
jgi:tetratricopeptide (TPR) repeat protein